jgi:hypothetical protein
MMRMLNKLKTLFHKTTTKSALDLLTAQRIDVTAKYLYCKHYLKGSVPRYIKQLYLHHLKVLNNFYEEGKFTGEYTISAEKFIKKFNHLIDDVNLHGFLQEISNIWIDKQGNLINGAHRLATCLCLGISPTTEIKPEKYGQKVIDYNYLQNKKDFVSSGLRSEYAKRMVLEFIHLKPTSYSLTMFPVASNKFPEVEKLVETSGEIIYKTSFEPSELGAFNLIETLYRNEPWLGKKESDFKGIRAKQAACFTKKGKVTVYFIDVKSHREVLKLKQHIRSLFTLDKHSCHINDTHVQSVRIAETVLNPNGLLWLNKRQSLDMPNFSTLFVDFRKWTNHQHIDLDDVCVGGSGVLALYGLRDCQDIDFIHANKKIASTKQFGSHNKYLEMYGVSLEEILHNPKYHLYYEGVKFMKLDLVANMKRSRKEKKDFEDLKLIGNA